MNKVAWRPQPKQALFMARPEEEALYGGAAGGGKSDALIIEALRQVHVPYYRGLIVRRTFPQMEDLIDKSVRYYKKAFPQAKYNESKHFWRFPSGAKIFFGSMPHEKDKYNYQGKPYDFIGFDELTQFTATQYEYLTMSRNRPNGPGTRVYCRATANPGGVGHGWVKERFITAATPMTTITDKVQYLDDKGIRHERARRRIFVPSSVFDNPALMANDPDYVSRLASLPDAERNALLYGDWDTFSGQVFTEWRNDQAHYDDRTNTHVIEPFIVPQEWTIWRSFDWGYARPFSVGWYAVDRERRLYRIRELYGYTGTPNQGIKWEPARVAQEIKRIEAEDPNIKGRRVSGVGDPAIWQSSGTESIGALMERERVYFKKGENSRIDGKMQVHHRLAFDDLGVPMLYIFNTCKNFIRTVPNLVYDERDVEDVNTEGEDHIYDELRYVCMENPIAPPIKKEAKKILYDPLDLMKDTQYDRYKFFRRY